MDIILQKGLVTLFLALWVISTGYIYYKKHGGLGKTFFWSILEGWIFTTVVMCVVGVFCGGILFIIL